MKRSKFTEAQIAFILRQGDEGTAVGEICRKAGICEAKCYNWRKKYGGLMPSEMKRLRQLEEENGKLKKIVADLSLDKEMLQDVIPKRRVKAKLREDRQSATRPNETWAMDFVHDQLVTGRKLRVLTIIDTFSRFSPAIEPRFNFRGPDVVEILEEVGRQVGFPKAIRVDQGTEFVSRDLDLWAYQRGVTLDFSRPGKPTDNAFIESFNGKFRAECLNAHWFMSLDDARRKCEAWRRDYNEERPHSAIGNKAPIELIDRSVAYGPR
jgi:putative transposase